MERLPTQTKKCDLGQACDLAETQRKVPAGSAGLGQLREGFLEEVTSECSPANGRGMSPGKGGGRGQQVQEWPVPMPTEAWGSSWRLSRLCDCWVYNPEEQCVIPKGGVERGSGSLVRKLTCETSSRPSPGAQRHSHRPG